MKFHPPEQRGEFWHLDPTDRYTFLRTGIWVVDALLPLVRNQDYVLHDCIIFYREDDAFWAWMKIS